MDLREKIAKLLSQQEGAQTIWDDHLERADAILQIPELAAALVAKEQLDAAREDWTVGDVRGDIYEQMRDIRPLG